MGICPCDHQLLTSSLSLGFFRKAGGEGRGVWRGKRSISRRFAYSTPCDPQAVLFLKPTLCNDRFDGQEPRALLPDCKVRFVVVIKGRGEAPSLRGFLCDRRPEIESEKRGGNNGSH
jgi:hypothetical protein